jgi:group I intron endonuclease
VTTQAGVYRIDGPSGKFYIGSSTKLKQRWAQHRKGLMANRHANKALQNAWNKYGEDSFTFRVLELVDDPSQLLAAEQRWIDETGACRVGYNIRITAESNAGLRQSEETRRKMSLAHTGRKHGPMSEEQKACLSNLLAGRKLSEETRARMSQSRMGRKLSEETRKKISEAHKGKIVSPETRVKFSMVQTGKKHSEETKAKMRQSHQRRLQHQTTMPL